MTSPAPSHDVSDRCKSFVEDTAKAIPTFAPLHKFLTDDNDELKCEIMMVEFEAGQKLKVSTREVKTIEELADLLKEDVGHRLFLVQNLVPKVVKLLGGHWEVPADFFLAHLENSNWYSLQNIPENLPTLSSIHPGHVRFQFIGPREFDGDGSRETQLLDDRIREDETATVRRIARGYNPTMPPKSEHESGEWETRDIGTMNPVAFVRTSVTIWFDRLECPNQEPVNHHEQKSVGPPALKSDWQKGIILFDPPFEAADPRLRNKKHNSVYRSFLNRRPPPDFSKEDIDSRDSYMESFIKCLLKNEHIQGVEEIPRPFVILEDLCRIIASEWIVFNTYVERELNNIERWFEDEGETCERLHEFLTQLMKIRRRVTKYDTLVSDQLQLCPEHGKRCGLQDHAASSMPSPLMAFHHVQSHFAYNKARISQAIKVATSLMAVNLNKLISLQNSEVVLQNKALSRQNELSQARNASLAFLTGVTSFILPFTAIASIMTIPAEKELGPRSQDFWIFWIAACVTAFALLLTFRVVWVYNDEGAKLQAENEDKGEEAKLHAKNRTKKLVLRTLVGVVPCLRSITRSLSNLAGKETSKSENQEVKKPDTSNKRPNGNESSGKEPDGTIGSMHQSNPEDVV